MKDERRERTAQALRDAGADFAILTSPDAVCYATGHAVPIETGPSPFAGGPSTALVAADGSAALITANVESGNGADVDVIETYVGFTIAEPAQLEANYVAAVRAAAARIGLSGVLAIEPGAYPSILRDAFASARQVSIGPTLARQRATKTVGELALLHRAAETAATGQRAALREARPGVSELALFGAIRTAMETFVGERLPLAGDLVSGAARTAGIGGWPNGRMIADRDPVIADLGPRVGGYWGDSCGSFVVGAAPESYRRAFRAARGALDLALAIMRPGLPVAELDAQLRAHMARAGFAYPHHSGHSIGTAVHEWPRIVPYERTPLQPDMVLMVEPGAYDPAFGGVRTEWMIRITRDGCEPVAPFAHLESTDELSEAR